MNMKPFFKGMWDWTKRHSTKLLATGAVVSQWVALYFMHKEAPIVRDRLEELGPDANWKDKLKVTAPVYWPAIGMMLVASGCVVGGCAVGERKAAIMASLYSASEASLRKLEEKVVEKVGKEKAQEIHDSIADDMMAQNPPTPDNIEYTGNGGDLFWEPWGGRWFYSSLDAYEEANRKFKNHVLENMWGSMNDWYEFQGLQRSEGGQFVGWNVEHPLDIYTIGEERATDRKLYHIIRYANKPVLYTGKEPKDFSNCDACYI